MAQREADSGSKPLILALHPTFDTLDSKLGTMHSVAFEYVGQMHVAEDSAGNRLNKGALWLIRVGMTSCIAMARRGIALRPERILLCKPQPINGIAAIWIRFVTGIPFDLDCDDYELGSNHFGTGIGATSLRRVIGLFERLLPKLARKVTVNTQFMADKCVDWGVLPSAIQIVPNAVWDVPRRDWLKARRTELRSSLSIGNAYLIVYIGAMSTVAHSVDMLLKALKLVIQKFPDVQLYMVGTGPELPELKLLACQLGVADSVVWIGQVARERRWDYFAIADCTVDPVRDTPGARARSPLKIYESVAAGVPVVTANVGDRSRIDSRLIRFGDPSIEGLANALAQMVHCTSCLSSQDEPNN